MNCTGETDVRLSTHLLLFFGEISQTDSFMQEPETMPDLLEGNRVTIKYAPGLTACGSTTPPPGPNYTIKIGQVGPGSCNFDIDEFLTTLLHEGAHVDCGTKLAAGEGDTDGDQNNDNDGDLISL